MKRMPRPERLVPFLRAARLQGCLLRLHLSDYSSYVLLIDSHQRLPRRALRRVPRRALPTRTRRARGRVLHPRRVEGGAPALLVIPRELKVVTLARHADGDMSNASPRVEPGAESPEGAVVGEARKPGEAKGCSQQLAALVEVTHVSPRLSSPGSWPSNSSSQRLCRFQSRGHGDGDSY